MVVALATSGRAVLFAGCTVIISLLGLFIVGLPFMHGLAVGAIAAVVLVMAAALTLLPAMLGFAGQAIDRLHVPGLLQSGSDPVANSGFWYRWSRMVQRHPWSSALARSGGAGGAGRPAVLDAPGLHRRRQRPASPDHPAGLRPAGRGLRSRVQRAAGHGRPRCRPAGDRVAVDQADATSTAGHARRGLRHARSVQRRRRHRGHHRLPDHLTPGGPDGVTGPPSAAAR